MPFGPVWTEDEWAVLLELYLREGRDPRPQSIEETHDLLRALGLMSEDPRRRRSARNPSYRSLGAVWAQFYVVRSLDEPGRRVHVPRRLRTLWERHKRDPEVVPARAGYVFELVGARRKPFGLVERPSLKLFLVDVSQLLDEAVDIVVGLDHSAIGADMSDTFAAAWADIQGRSVLDSIDDELNSVDVARLADAGLAGVQLDFKLVGWREALREWRTERTAEALRRAFRWANIVLGSLGKALTGPGLEVFKEFKEGTEAVLDEAIPPGGFIPLPVPACSLRGWLGAASRSRRHPAGPVRAEFARQAEPCKRGHAAGQVRSAREWPHFSQCFLPARRAFPPSPYRRPMSPRGGSPFRPEPSLIRARSPCRPPRSRAATRCRPGPGRAGVPRRLVRAQAPTASLSLAPLFVDPARLPAGLARTPAPAPNRLLGTRVAEVASAPSLAP